MRPLWDCSHVLWACCVVVNHAIHTASSSNKNPGPLVGVFALSGSRPQPAPKPPAYDKKPQENLDFVLIQQVLNICGTKSQPQVPAQMTENFFFPLDNLPALTVRMVQYT